MVSEPPYRLVLHPAGPEYAPEDSQLLECALREIGLIGARFSGEPASRFLAGERLLELVIFLGCSPAVELAPPDDPQSRNQGRFCHVRLPAPTPAGQARSGLRQLQARCPHCRHRVVEPERLLEQVRHGGTGVRWQCPGCGAELAIPDLNWRHSAGFARTFIEIWGVFPHEAVPSDELLDTLSRETGVKWRYFYSDRP